MGGNSYAGEVAKRVTTATEDVSLAVDSLRWLVRCQGQTSVADQEAPVKA